MSRTMRRTLGFESLEGKLLLSSGMAHRAKAAPAIVHRARDSQFLLDGTVHGLPFGSIQSRGIQVSSFNVVGKARAMGRVNGSFRLANPFIARGKMPDLSNSTLTLSNSKGSVQLTMASSPSSRYVFVVTSGTGSYATASGSGTAVISFNRKMIQFVVKLHSAIH